MRLNSKMRADFFGVARRFFRLRNVKGPVPFSLFPFPPRHRGFTLIELLVVVSIIGTLAAAGTVSYSSVRSTARDAKRLSDVRQLQAAIEIYYENHDAYPADGRPGPLGVHVGEAATATLSDAGFAGATTGQIYMIKTPQNALPYGASYVYRSLDADGRDCDSDCQGFQLLFYLEKGAGDFKGGTHAVGPYGITPDPDGYVGQDIVVNQPPTGSQLEAGLDRYAAETARIVGEFAANQTVQQVTERGVAPAASVFAVVNTAVASGSQLYHFFLFLVQPLQLLRRRRGRAWGTVYNSLTRLPEDLAIVRLIHGKTGRIIRSQVTDAAGRFSFLVAPGTYRLAVAKLDFVFPSRIAAQKTEDGPFVDLYHGDVLSVPQEGLLTPNIPIDPPEAATTERAVRRDRARRGRRRSAAVLSLGLGVVAFILRPTAVTGLLFAAQVILYLLFKRLAEPPEPKTWGVVRDQLSGKPVTQAIIRIFEGKYNKLLETQVTDREGRYHFRVGPNTYYLTVTKAGYLKTETTPVDLTRVKGATVIASDLPLQRDPNVKTMPPRTGANPVGGADASPTPRPPVGKGPVTMVAPPVVPSAKQSSRGVTTRQSLSAVPSEGSPSSAVAVMPSGVSMESILPRWNGNGVAKNDERQSASPSPVQGATPASVPEPESPAPDGKKEAGQPMVPPSLSTEPPAVSPAEPPKRAWFRDV
jgi:general secretion pathway protein G